MFAVLNLGYQAQSVKQEFDAGQTNVTLAMLRFLSDWLNNHIMGEDKQYVGFLIAKGVS